MRIIFIILFIIGATVLPAGSDEIHLNDGRIIKGKIIQVKPNVIEYDPEGREVFNTFPRGQIKKIVFDNGSVIMLNEGGGNKYRNRTDTSGNNEEQSYGIDDYHSHDGFYFRFQWGYGSGKSTFENNFEFTK